MNDVIRKYSYEKKELEERLKEINENAPISMYGRYNVEEENIKARIKEIDEIIRKFYNILVKTWYIRNDDLSLEKISELRAEVNDAKADLPTDVIEYVDKELGIDITNFPVVRKYIDEKQAILENLQNIASDRPIGMYGRYNDNLEKSKLRIEEIDKTLKKFNNLMVKIDDLKNGGYSYERSNELRSQVMVSKKDLPDDLRDYISKEMSSIVKLAEPGTYEYYLDRRNELVDKFRNFYDNVPTGMYGRANIERPASLERELDYINDLLSTYERVKYNIGRLEKLKSGKLVGDRDEIIELGNKIRADKNKLPVRLLKELEDYLVSKDKTEKDKKVETKGLELDAPVEVVSRRKAKRKFSKGFIAAGISAVVVATVAALQALVPAISSAVQSLDVSTLASTMADNATMWHSASAVDQSLLHSANTGLASAISNLTGQASAFDSISGSWTVGGMDLTSFAASASDAVHSAVDKVALLSATSASLFTGGIASLISGIKRRKKDNERFDKYDREVSKLNEYYRNYFSDDFVAIDYFQIKQLYNNIKSDDSLSKREKEELLDKLDELYETAKVAVASDVKNGGRHK